ncbi:MAG: helix-turn-helix transcriptional regulator, partial [Traorella sp.]
FIPIYQNNELKVYIYYEVFSVFMIWMGILTFRNSNSLELDKSKKLMKRIGLYLIIFGIFIIIEDYIVIFNIDSYTPEHISIQNRCYTEDIFRFLISLSSIAYIVSKINPHFQAHINSEPHSLHPTNFEENVENEENKPIVLSAEEKMMSFGKKYDLTSREMEILKMILEHKNAQEISDALYIATGTVKTHMHKIYQKLGITKRTQLIVLYNEFNPQS